MRTPTYIPELITLEKGRAFVHPDPSLKISQRVSEYGIRSGKVFRTKRTEQGRLIKRVA